MAIKIEVICGVCGKFISQKEILENEHTPYAHKKCLKVKDINDRPSFGKLV